MTTVLIVDDDENITAMVGALIDQAGYEIMVADSALAAVNLLQGPRQIDVVLADYILAGVDGLSLIQTLRYYRPELAAVVVTANASPELREDSHARGIGHIVKPFLVADLVVAIEDALAVSGTKPGGNT
jgi:CheY-like chemotaxis protein